MKKFVLLVLATLSVLSIYAQDITGNWNGILNIQGTKLRLVFHVTQSEKGYHSTMDSPDQGAIGIPVTSTSFENSVLKIEIPSAKIQYKGTLNKENIFAGTFIQAGKSFPLNLKKKKSCLGHKNLPNLFPIIQKILYLKILKTILYWQGH